MAVDDVLLLAVPENETPTRCRGSPVGLLPLLLKPLRRFTGIKANVPPHAERRRAYASESPVPEGSLWDAPGVREILDAKQVRKTRHGCAPFRSARPAAPVSQCWRSVRRNVGCFQSSA